MSTPGSFAEERQGRTQKDVLGPDYVPTDEELKLLRECTNESFVYRALPFAAISMAITNTLITKGILSASPRFGAAPKVAFAGIFGFFTGKLSYMKKCQEKFKNLPNSPLGDLVRQRGGVSQYDFSAQSELSDPNVPSYDTPLFQPADAPSSMSSFTTDDGQMGRPDDLSTPVQSYEEEEPKKKSILYEDLRHKNRENYEVMLNQKADTTVKASSAKEPARPKKPGTLQLQTCSQDRMVRRG
uniref:OCIA domain-containing protein 1 n=1 Tax=Kryptolebias marmoratus TaxID=37003 RepID=A0A3Q3BS12_KRYMA